MKETSSSEGNNTLLSSCTYLVCIVSVHILYIYLLEDNMFQEELYLWKKNKIRIAIIIQERMKYIKQILWKLLQGKPKSESILKKPRRKKSAIKRKLEKDL
jgi:hypothetical protein